MKRFNIVCGLILTASALSACSDSGSPDSNIAAGQNPAAAQPSSTQDLSSLTSSATARVTSEMLQGFWRANCLASSDGTSLGGSNEYSGDNYRATAVLYADSGCSDSIAEITASGDYTLGSANFTSSGASVTELDAIGVRMDFKPTDADLAGWLNTNGFCERTNWQAGVSQDVTDCRLLDGNFDNYDIVEFDGNDHYYGINTDSKDGLSAANRPNSVDYDVRYSKIQNDDTTQSNESTAVDGVVTPDSVLEAYYRKAIALRP